ncbi:MAG TPA: sigma-70 family RNA polymerase sigma factor [Acidimicrobiales bacterium]|jgi:RNA polymerase sigma-70 factor (ECF subfamily)|nr:sigma-70 family RNA polymerase sigma factor [Acidimicrobiales bacterium]
MAGAPVGGRDFSAAFPRLFARAFQVAVRVLDNSGEAEDVAAEAMARTLRSWRRVGQMDAPEAWVVRVAANLSVDVLRRRRRAGQWPAREAEPAARTGDPDARMAVIELMAVLPRRQREVLVLRYLADLSEADIAGTLGIAPGSVKAHASRAIRRLRSVVAEGGVEDGRGVTFAS